jgi:hypothetical protein
MNPKRSNGSRTHRFGGDWTTAKLDVIARYLESYTTALKDKPSADHPFVNRYVDAFAEDPASVCCVAQGCPARSARARSRGRALE